jgi:hypothetical protein
LGVRAESDLFGSGYESVSEHLIEPHQEFIDDINQEVRSHLVKNTCAASIFYNEVA